MAVRISLGFGLILSEHWAKVLLYFSPTAFEQADPQFGQDISFVAYENRSAMAETLDQALRAIFQSDQNTSPTIVRPVGEGVPSEAGPLPPDGGALP